MLKQAVEFPWQVDGFFVVGGALAAGPLLMTFRHRQVEHLYVRAWYIAAALIVEVLGVG